MSSRMGHLLRALSGSLLTDYISRGSATFADRGADRVARRARADPWQRNLVAGRRLRDSSIQTRYQWVTRPSDHLPGCGLLERIALASVAVSAISYLVGAARWYGGRGRSCGLSQPSAAFA